MQIRDKICRPLCSHFVLKMKCISVLFLVLFSFAAASQQGYQLFNSGYGHQTFTVPPGVTTITVEAVGWGGCGGGYPGGGGGGGGFAKGAYSVVPGSTIALRRSADTFFVHTFLYVTDGRIGGSGYSATGGIGGQGGKGVGGNIANSYGGNGGSAYPGYSGGGGGGAGGINGNGYNGSNGSFGTPSMAGSGAAGGEGGGGLSGAGGRALSSYYYDL
jgi:hypothetical protein